MLVGHYDAGFVSLSVIVAVIASYTAFTLAERVATSTGLSKRWWIAGGAFSMGTGIWAMHFVGMLAFQLAIPVGYDLRITFISWIFPVVVSTVALYSFGVPHPTRLHLAIASVALGLGISAMHYTGMAAMRMSPPIIYTQWLVLASVVLAVIASNAALTIGLRLRRVAPSRSWTYRGSAATVMGLAIAGMHYTGMSAAQFAGDAVCRAAAGEITPSALGTIIVIATLALLLVTLLVAVYDARLEAKNAVLAQAARAADQRQGMLERESALRLEAERLGTIKDEFLATLSHELRTPLNAILGWAQILRMAPNPDAIGRAIETIERNARLQARLIDDLLDMSRIISGRVFLELERLDLCKLVEAAVEAVRPAAEAKRIVLTVAVQRRPDQMMADGGRLHQVFWNTLSNAVKFTPEGGSIAVNVGQEDNEAAITIRDSGVGIDADFLPHVFERFRQADASTTRRYGGLGVGLAITRQLVELHGGRLQAFSAGSGTGTTITIRLPTTVGIASATQTEYRTQGGRREPTTITDDCTLKGIPILVVDDDPDACEMLSRVLLDQGASVETVTSAAAALDRVARGDVQVLVSDIGMPEMDGFELIRRVRAHPSSAVSGIGSLAVTAFAHTSDESRALSLGFDGFLRKPIDIPLLIDAILQIMQKAPSHTG